jgi:hypothetical protein
VKYNEIPQNSLSLDIQLVGWLVAGRCCGLGNNKRFEHLTKGESLFAELLTFSLEAKVLRFPRRWIQLISVIIILVVIDNRLKK